MANSKITELDAAAGVTADDLIPIVNDPGGTPATQKATAAQVLAYIEGAIGTAAFRALIDDASASDMRTTLGLGTIATQAANNVSITGGSVTGITDIALADGGTGASLVDPNADRILFWDDSAGQVTWLTAGSGLTITDTTITGSGSTLDYICIWDQKDSGSSNPGGTFTAGAWRTRDLNTEHADTGGHASVGSNQITLAAGTYRCHVRCPAYDVDQHQARLQNITDATTILMGSSAMASGAGGTDAHMTDSVISGRFTLAAQKTLEVQHRCNTTRNTDGFGTSSAFSIGGDHEIFTVAEFWRES